MAIAVPLPCHGQAKPAPQAAQFDPSDVYFQGYLATRSAEQLEAADDFAGALEKLQRAEECFGALWPIGGFAFCADDAAICPLATVP